MARPSSNGQMAPPNFRGDGLTLDPASGFLISTQINGFNADKKRMFVKLAADLWPDSGSICDIVGITYTTWQNHYQLDKKFRQCLDEIKERKVDKVESSMFTYAHRPQNFMDRMAILRAHRGNVYNPDININISNKISDDQAWKKKAAIENAIDAEIVTVSATALEAETPSTITLEQSSAPVGAPPSDPVAIAEPISEKK